MIIAAQQSLPRNNCCRGRRKQCIMLAAGCLQTLQNPEYFPHLISAASQNCVSLLVNGVQRLLFVWWYLGGDAGSLIVGGCCWYSYCAVGVWNCNIALLVLWCSGERGRIGGSGGSQWQPFADNSIALPVLVCFSLLVLPMFVFCFCLLLAIADNSIVLFCAWVVWACALLSTTAYIC